MYEESWFLSFSFSLSLSLGLLIIFLAAPCDAAKVTLEKEEIFSIDGVLLGFRDFPAPVLTTLGVLLIADYPSYVAGEVDDSRVAAFEQAAIDRGISFALHPDWDVISMNGYTFPSSGPPDWLPPDLQISGFDGETGLYLLQLKAPPAVGWPETLGRAGDVIGYYPWNTYLMRFPPSVLPTVRALGFVQHVSPYQPAYKISPSIQQTDEPVDVVVVLDAGQELTDVTALLDSFGGNGVAVLPGGLRGVVQVTVDRVRLRTLAYRPEVLWIEPQYGIELSGEREATIVAGQYDGSVPPAEPIRYPGTPGGHEGWLLDKGFCTPSGGGDDWMWYWTKVGVFDSGLDRTECAEDHYNTQTGECSAWDEDRHPDLAHNSNLEGNCPEPGEGIEWNSDCDDAVVYGRRYCWGPDPGSNGCLDEVTHKYVFSDEAIPNDGHGTSVASIIAGDPHLEPHVDAGGYYRGSGVAPSAQIVLAKIGPLDLDGQAGGMTAEDWASLVAKVNCLGNPEWAGTVRFANNSWNLKKEDDQTLYDEYTLFSQLADELVRDADQSPSNGLQEMTLVFSVGNCADYIVLCPAASPGNAKNIISVGASRGFSDEEDEADEECTDLVHHISDISGFDVDDHPPYSRRQFSPEPERFKPDLVAPGSQVAAARSSSFEFNPEWNIHRCFRGTSAAAPVVTGSAVLAEAWYWHTFGHVLPSPAMIKAMLVAHADDLYLGHDHKTHNPLPHSPSIAQGWGRVNLDTLIPDNSPPPSPPVAVFDQDHGSAGRRFTQTGQYWSVQLQVADPGEDIIAVMVFTDAPSEAGAQSLVKNDLDLRLTKLGIGGSGRTYVGNYFVPGSWYSQNVASQIVKPKDAHNTVEVIRVPAGDLTGNFSVRITAASIVAKAVPGLDGGANNQDFALYVHNATQ